MAGKQDVWTRSGAQPAGPHAHQPLSSAAGPPGVLADYVPCVTLPSPMKTVLKFKTHVADQGALTPIGFDQIGIPDQWQTPKLWLQTHLQKKKALGRLGGSIG